MNGRRRARVRRVPWRRSAFTAAVLTLAGLVLTGGSASAQVGFTVDGGLVRYDLDLPDTVTVSGFVPGHGASPVQVLLDGNPVAIGTSAADESFTVPFTLPAPPAGTNACGGAAEVSHDLTVVAGSDSSQETSGMQKLVVRCPDSYVLRSDTPASASLAFSNLTGTSTTATACISARVGGVDVGAVQGKAGGPTALAFQVVANPARAGHPAPDVTDETPVLRGDGCYNIPLPPVVASYAGTLSLQALRDTDGVPGPSAGDTVLPGATQTLQRSRLVTVPAVCGSSSSFVVAGSRWDENDFVQVTVTGADGATSTSTAVVDPAGRFTDSIDQNVVLPATVTTEQVDNFAGDNPRPVDAQPARVVNSCTDPTAAAVYPNVARPQLTVAPAGTKLTQQVTVQVQQGSVVTATLDGTPATIAGSDGSPVVTGADNETTFSVVEPADDPCGPHVIVVTAVLDDSSFTSVQQGLTSYETVCPTLVVTPGTAPESDALIPITVSGTGWNTNVYIQSPGIRTAPLQTPHLEASFESIQLSLASSDPAQTAPQIGAVSSGQVVSDQDSPDSNVWTGHFSVTQYVPRNQCGTVWTLTGQDGMGVAPYSALPTASTRYVITCPGQASVTATPTSAGVTAQQVLTTLDVEGYAAGQAIIVSYDGDPSLHLVTQADGPVTVQHRTGACGSHLFTVTPTVTTRQSTTQQTPGGSPTPVETYTGPAQTTEAPATPATLPTTVPVQVTCPTAGVTPPTVPDTSVPRPVVITGSGFTPGKVVTVAGGTATVDQLGRFSTPVQVTNPACGQQTYPVTEFPASGVARGNGVIAFVQITDESTHTQIWTVGPSGTQVDVSGTAFGDDEPSFSPDGSKLVFRSGGSHILTMNADGTDRFDLTAVAGGSGHLDRHPSWSPDGTTILFDDNNHLTTMKTDGTARIPLGDQTGTDLDAVWSPDGTLIAFASYRAGETLHVFTEHPDGTGLTDISAATIAPGRTDTQPAWTADSQHVDATSDRDGAGQQVWQIGRDGSSPVELTAAEPNAANPAPAPDGSGVAYIVNNDGNTQVTVDGRTLSSASNAFGDGLSWQPVPGTAPASPVPPVGAADGVTSTAVLTVTCSSAVVVLYPAAYAYTPGARTVGVMGTGFAPSSVVDLTLDGVPTGETATTDATGAFDTTTTLVGLVVGPHAVGATGVRRAASAVLTVSRARVSLSQPTLSNDAFPPSDTVVGGGFDPARPVTVALPGVGLLGPVVPGPDGSFTLSFDPHKLTCGLEQAFTATEPYDPGNVQGAASASGTFSVTCVNAPVIAAVPPVIAQAGGTRVVHVTGTGFRGLLPVVVTVPGFPPVTVTSGGNGSLAVDVPVTNPTCGPHPLSAVPQTGFSAGASVLVTCPVLTPGLTSFSEQAVPATIALTGSGYDPDTDVTVGPAAAGIGVVHTDSRGAFHTQIAGSALLCGASTLTGVETLPGVTPPPAATTTVTKTCRVVAPTLTASPDVVPDGTVVTGKASGYNRLSTVRFTWLLADGGAGLGTATCVADESGSCTVSMLVLPHDQGGDRMLVGTDAANAVAMAPVLVVANSVQPGRQSSSTARRHLLGRR